MLKRPSSLHFICLFFIPFLAFTSAAILPRRHATNIIQPIESDESTINQPANLNFGPEYMVYPVFDGPSLDETSLLMSAVQLMAREATENINQDVRRMSWKSPDARFSDIVILVLPPSNAYTITRRLMMWALSEGLQLLMQRNRFAAVKFRITRDKINVGSIEIGHLLHRQQQQLDLDTTRTSTTTDSPNLPTLSTSKTETSSADSIDNTPLTPTPANTIQVFAIQIYIRRSTFGYDLSPTDVFRPVIATLAHVAQFPPRSCIKYYKTPVTIGQTSLKLSDNRSGEGPFLHKEQLIETAAKLPLFMINKGIFFEVDVEVRLPSEVLIAKGRLKRERTPRLGELREMGVEDRMLPSRGLRASSEER